MICPHCQHETPADADVCATCHAPLPGTDGGEVTRLSAGETSAVGDWPPASTSAGSMFGPGVLFAGRYRIVRLLGAGGMGAVYEAVDQELGLSIALKVVRADVTPDAESARDFERRFKQELLLARQVSHPNVLRIHDLGDAGGIKYITMSYVQGRDLAALLKQERLSLARSRALARQLAAGLAAAHDVGIVHRDLKPQNILIGENDRLYISDFGLAKSLEATTAGLTRPGEFFGTPRYVAPEQVEGGPVDHRVDIYALGLIFYEMVAGETPFEGPSALELMLRRVRERPRPPQEVVPELPEYINGIIMRCLEREPAARYQSAHEIERDLAQERSSVLSVAQPVPPRTSARYGWGIAAALTAAVAVVGLALALLIVPTIRRALLRGAPHDASAGISSASATRVVVLPFSVTGDQAVLGPTAAGLDESLSSKLFGLNGVALTSASAGERAARKGSLQAIGREVGAAFVVTGTVQGGADRLRVIANLDDVAANKRVWSEEFSGVPADLLTLEDRVYQALVNHLHITPTSAEVARTLGHPTENIDAYAAYLKGRRAMRGEQDLSNVRAAIADYEDALKKDPNFALAYAGIADSSLRMYRATKDASWAARALSAAQQAQGIDDKLVEVHVSLGNVYQATGRTSEAIVELKRAAELAPNSDDAHRRLGRAYLTSGRGDEAIAAYRQAVAVNPYHWVNSDSLGAAYLQLGRYDEGIASFKKVIDLAPDNVNGYNDLGAAYLRTAHFDEAIAAFQKALTLQPIPNTYTNLGIAYADAGRFSDAVPMFEKAVELQPNAEAFVGNLADGYRWAGQRARADATYDRAIALALKALQVNTRDAVIKGNLALYYAKKGDAASARRFMSEARAIDTASADLLYNEAVMSALLGDTDRAFTDLRKALDAGLPFSSIDTDPDLARLRKDPRFASLRTAAGRR
ncbi:MAG TPA: tetratricopeptide repeat protein [Vicinamibacterales bacterium]|jgi:serine/threonine-protein kinase|nr:tetratricopeptide repeat protein [Vicinamibacterales bacterium]